MTDDEILKVARDAFTYGTGFMRDGKHVPTEDVYMTVEDVVTDDLVKRLRERTGLELECVALDAADRIEQLEAALRECEQIVKRKQDENICKTQWQGSNIAHAKAKATATRCGEILGEIRKHVRAALGEKK